MKTLFNISFTLLLTVTAFSQTPQGMSYQAIVRDSGNTLVTEQPVGVQISILQGSATGTAVYAETHTATTNTNGLLTLVIGTGSTADDFTSIDWSNGPYFIQTETDPTGGSNYTITATSQLLSVPYALHAQTAETIAGGITETDPVYSAWDKSTGISITESQITDLQNYLTSEIDDSVTNELQALSISNDTIYLSNGGFVKLPGALWQESGNNMHNLNTGNVGIGVSSPSTKLEVDGSVTIPNGSDYRYANAITKTLIVPGEVFAPNNQYGNLSFAHLNLPDGAVITGFTAHVYDNSTVSNITVYLGVKSFDVFSSSPLIQTDYSSGTGHQYLGSTISSSPTINNASNAYLLYANIDYNAQLLVHSVMITYTIDKVD